jgi:pentatricopeptide repeat protein
VDKECYALAIDTCARRNQYMHAERLLHDMQVQSPTQHHITITHA